LRESFEKGEPLLCGQRLAEPPGLDRLSQPQALGVVGGCLAVFLGLSIWAYDPSFGIQQRKAGAAAAA